MMVRLSNDDNKDFSHKDQDQDKDFARKDKDKVKDYTLILRRP